MSSNGYVSGFPHEEFKTVLDTEAGVSVRIKAKGGGKNKGAYRLYVKLDDGSWGATAFDPRGGLLGHGVGPTWATARQEMLDAAGLAA